MDPQRALPGRYEASQTSCVTRCIPNTLLLAPWFISVAGGSVMCAGRADRLIGCSHPLSSLLLLQINVSEGVSCQLPCREARCCTHYAQHPIIINIYCCSLYSA